MLDSEPTLSDWHSPIMVLLWMASERVIAGPGGMLVLQTIVLWSGLALLHLAPSGPSLSALWRALAASAALLAAAQGLNAAVVDARTTPAQIVALADLNGIAKRTGASPSVDPCHHKTSEQPPARAASMDEPKVGAALERTRRRLGVCVDEAASRTLLEQWVRLVLEHPLAYADVRAYMAFRLLGFRETPVTFVMTRSNYDAATAGIEPPVPPTPAQLRLDAWIRGLGAGHLFRPWIYGVVGIGAVLVAARRRRWWPCAVALSGIAFELVLFLVAPLPEYRYSYWMIVSTLIAATWLAVEAIGGRSLRLRAAVTRRASRAAPPA